MFDSTRLRQATPALFEAANYAGNSRPITGQGGRGAAWFVQGEFGAAVLRQYRRGGWMAKFGEDGYLWQGQSAVRSWREFALLAQLHRIGLPVPAPIAALYRRSGLIYRAAILVEEFAQARPFAELVGQQQAYAPWAAVGVAIARCHRRHAHHVDLNAHNILVDRAGAVCLIDWDKGRIEPATGAWCDGVLDRLERSLRKIFAHLSPGFIVQGMKSLREAHQQELGS